MAKTLYGSATAFEDQWVRSALRAAWYYELEDCGLRQADKSGVTLRCGHRLSNPEICKYALNDQQSPECGLCRRFTRAMSEFGGPALGVWIYRLEQMERSPIKTTTSYVVDLCFALVMFSIIYAIFQLVPYVSPHYGPDAPTA